MKKISAVFLIGAFAISLTGCSNMNNQDTGTIIGGVAGGLLGSQFGSGGGQVAATLIGAAAGAYVGNRVGNSMDKADQAQAGQALENNRTGQTSTWHNPDSGNSYAVTPTKTYTRDYHHRKQYCREFTQTATIAGKQQEIYGTACRKPDGTWEVVSEKNPQ